MGTGLRNKIIVITLILTTFLALFRLGHRPSVEEVGQNPEIVYSSGQILRVVSDETINDPGVTHFPRGTLTYEVEILRGLFAGRVLEAPYHMSSPAHVRFEAGDRVSVRIFEFEGDVLIAEVRYPERSSLLLGASGLFLVFLCVIGGKRGVLSALGLVFTIGCVIFLLIPLITAGFPIVPMTLLVLGLVTVATIFLLAGLTPKGVASILGCLSGVMVAALFAYVAGNLARINGYNLGNYRAIFHLAEGTRMEGLFISSVLVASIGAVMDTSMSVASAMEEVKLADPQISRKELFRAGFNVSRDVMGTMSSTLILAFIGGSLSLIIFMYARDVSFNQFINNDEITMEIIKGLAGSFGIVLASPLTALISTELLTRRT
ncbi:MAG: YibE/F family protein [Turicibacter sp.]|nr:YibE/F family protein [Turicibacter sp.]